MTKPPSPAPPACATIDPATRATPDSADGRVLLQVETGRICALNAVASRIWTEIDAGRSFEEIVERLAAEYEAPRDRIAADVRAFLLQLVRQRYVRMNGGGL